MKSTTGSFLIFSMVMLLCALRPLVLPVQASQENAHAISTSNWAFSYWNTQHKSLMQLPLSSLEIRFAAGFPGQIGRFTDGETVWVVRHITKPTRMLHSAVDCYRGLGYQISNIHVLERENKMRWRSFIAERNGQKLQVLERIFDAKQSQWTDVSAWYWETLFKSGKNEWWAVTQVQQLDTSQF